MDEVKTLKKQVSQRRVEGPSRVTAEDLLAGGEALGGATVIIQAIENGSPDEMRQLIDVMRRKRETGLAVLLAAASEGKVQLVAGFSKDLIDRGLHAGNWLKEVAPIVGGGGGGRPDWPRPAASPPTRSQQHSRKRTSRFAQSSNSSSSRRPLVSLAMPRLGSDPSAVCRCGLVGQASA